MSARRPSNVLITLSLAAALALTALTLVSPGARSSPVSPANGLPTDTRRNVTWYGIPITTPRSLHIESQSIGAVTPDEFQITYADGNFTLVYQRVAGGPITSQYTLSVKGLLEWNESQAEGWPQDGAVAYTDLGAGAFGRFPIQHTAWAGPNGVQLDSFLVASNKGDLTLNLTIADGFVSLPSKQILTPMEAKLSLEINHTMTVPGTRLALHIGLTTTQKITLQNQSWDDVNEFSSDDRAVNVTNQGDAASSSAFFAWSNNATVNNEVGRVVPSGPAQNGTQGDYDLYLSYPKPSSGSLQLSIVHDPTIGVVSEAYLNSLRPTPESPLPFRSDALVYAISLAAIAAVVAATALLVRRRDRKQP